MLWFETIFKLIGLAIVAIVAIVAVLFIGWIILILAGMLLIFSLTQAVGIPLSVTKNGKKIGYLKHFQFHTL